MHRILELAEFTPPLLGILILLVDNITETIRLGFGPMPHNKKRRLNPPSPNTIMDDEDDSSSE